MAFFTGLTSITLAIVPGSILMEQSVNMFNTISPIYEISRNLLSVRIVLESLFQFILVTDMVCSTFIYFVYAVETIALCHEILQLM